MKPSYNFCLIKSSFFYTKLAFYETFSKTQLCSLDCKWNSCDAEQHRKNKRFYKLYNYAIQREREPYNDVSVSQSDSKNSLIKMARLQELFIVLHSIKRAYYRAWHDGNART